MSMPGALLVSFCAAFKGKVASGGLRNFLKEVS
jgi:hypothetical protein